MQIVSAFSGFINSYSNGRKMHLGITRKEHKDLFSMDPDYASTHCTATDLKVLLFFSEKSVEA